MTPNHPFTPKMHPGQTLRASRQGAGWDTLKEHEPWKSIAFRYLERKQ